jgi:hypothetical protein
MVIDDEYRIFHFWRLNHGTGAHEAAQPNFGSMRASRCQRSGPVALALSQGYRTN